MRNIKDNEKYATADRMLTGGRMYGRRTEQDKQLLGAIYEAEKYVVFSALNKGNVHIIPDKKLKEIIRDARKEEHTKCEPPCPLYQSGHSVDADGHCNMECC